MSVIAPPVASNIRLMPIRDARFSPEMNPGDFVLVIPADRYTVNTYYVLEMFGAPVLYRCQGNFDLDAPAILLSDNGSREGQEVTAAAFAGMVIGYVVGVVRVLDHAALETGVARPMMVAPIAVHRRAGGRS